MGRLSSVFHIGLASRPPVWRIKLGFSYAMSRGDPSPPLSSHAHIPSNPTPSSSTPSYTPVPLFHPTHQSLYSILHTSPSTPSHSLHSTPRSYTIPQPYTPLQLPPLYPVPSPLLTPLLPIIRSRHFPSIPLVLSVNAKKPPCQEACARAPNYAAQRMDERNMFCRLARRSERRWLPPLMEAGTLVWRCSSSWSSCNSAATLPER